jgi:phosphatidylserine decarboxylase
LKRPFSAVREGLPVTLALWLTACVLATVWWVAGAALAIVGLLVLLFFRDPRRTPPRVDGAFLAPVDGRVVDARRGGDDGEYRVAVFMSVFNAHVVRAPCAGVISRVEHVDGGYGHAGAEDASLMNEHVVVDIAAEDGTPVTLLLVAGMVARRIVTPLKPGDEVSQGEKIGMIKFGSRVEVVTSERWRPTVNVGDRVRGGLTVVGEVG